MIKKRIEFRQKMDKDWETEGLFLETSLRSSTDYALMNERCLKKSERLEGIKFMDENDRATREPDTMITKAGGQRTTNFSNLKTRKAPKHQPLSFLNNPLAFTEL